MALIGSIILAGLYFIAAVVAPPLAVIGAIFIAIVVVDAIVVMRIYKMYVAARDGDVYTLKSLNSIGWAIVALLFSGLIPGIMMLIAHGPIERLQQE